MVRLESRRAQTSPRRRPIAHQPVTTPTMGMPCPHHSGDTASPQSRSEGGASHLERNRVDLVEGVAGPHMDTLDGVGRAGLGQAVDVPASVSYTHLTLPTNREV